MTEKDLRRWLVSDDKADGLVRTLTFHVGHSSGVSLDKIPSLKLTAFVPENGWFEDQFPFGMAYFQGQTVSFRECIRSNQTTISVHFHGFILRCAGEVCFLSLKETMCFFLFPELVRKQSCSSLNQLEVIAKNRLYPKNPGLSPIGLSLHS